MAERRSLLWAGFTAVFISTLIVTVVPVYLIFPFRLQTPLSVQASYLLRSVATPVSILSVGVAILCLTLLWKKTRIWKKAIAILGILILLLCSWFTFQNHFEWMFQPLANPLFVRAHEAKFLDPKDMVLAVENNGDAAAYPVRFLAYHHITQDVVGGRPLVATY